MLRSLLLVVILAIPLAPARAEHAYVNAGALGPPALVGGGEVRGEVSAGSSASLHETTAQTPGFIVDRSVFARSGATQDSGIVPQALMGIAGDIQMTNVSWNGGGQYRNVIASSTWYDTFYLDTGASTSPLHVQFDYFSHGIMSYTNAYSLNQAFGVSLSPLPGSDGFGNFHYASASATTKYGYAAGTSDLVNNGWDSFEINPIGDTGIVEYTGKVTLDLFINPDRAGLPTRGDFQMSSDLYLEMILGSGTQRTFVDGTGTAGMSGVYVVDPVLGRVTPESLGMSLTFASGMPSPNSVPEPASFASIVIGLAGLAWYKKRR